MTFFKSLIKELVEDGHTVDIATNESTSMVPGIYRELGCTIYPISWSRYPLSKGNIAAIKELKEVVKNGNYDIVHCHTPICAAATRIACKGFRKRGLKVIYTAHGFHFFKGAPLKNWLLFYPIEKLCACWTDTLITINKEDFERARKKFKARKVEYVPGVGIDIKKFADVTVDRKAKREELGISDDAFVLLSVGELNENKNHQIVIKALSKLNDSSIHYVIAGNGDKAEALQDMAKEKNVNLHLLGYRGDVAELYDVADVYILPSIREGLNVSIMEAMASSLPVICGRIRGNTDLIDSEGGILVDINNEDDIVYAISKIKRFAVKMGIHNREMIKQYDLQAVNGLIAEIYGGGYNHLSNILEIQTLRKSIDVPLDAFVVISVGELNRNKNHQIIVKALGRVNSNNIYYVIAGTGSEAENLENLANDLHIHLKLLGYRKDVDKLYNCANVNAFPSIREGLGMAAIEGMATGLPLVCSDNRGTRDYATKDNAVVCAPIDVKAYADAFLTLKKDPLLCKKMGKSGKKTVEKYALKNINQCMKKIYSC